MKNKIRKQTQYIYIYINESLDQLFIKNYGFENAGQMQNYIHF